MNQELSCDTKIYKRSMYPSSSPSRIRMNDNKPERLYISKFIPFIVLYEFIMNKAINWNINKSCFYTGTHYSNYVLNKPYITKRIIGKSDNYFNEKELSEILEYFCVTVTSNKNSTSNTKVYVYKDISLEILYGMLNIKYIKWNGTYFIKGENYDEYNFDYMYVSDKRRKTDFDDKELYNMLSYLREYI